MRVSLFHRAAGGLRRRLTEPAPPLVAVEVRQRSVGVVRLLHEGGRLALAAAASLELPAGAVRPSLTQANIAEGDIFRQALRSALERAGVLAGGRAALVLPDPVARLALIPAAELKAGGGKDMEELLRFRLRKTVPFDIREARLGWVRTGGRGGDRTRGGDPFLVAAARRAVLDEYEAACRSVGLEPGFVEVAALALVSAAFGGASAADRLLVNWDEGYVSIVVARGEWPLLVRTLPDEAAASSEQVAREVANTLLYHSERLGGAPLAAVVVRAAGVSIPEAISVLREATGIEPSVIDPWARLGAQEGGWASQALVGAAASLMRAA